MLKKIHNDQLIKGMFIQEFCGSWMEHPFWRSAFLLNSDKDLADIRGSSISELWIDTSKGLDVSAPEPEAKTVAEVSEVVEQTLAQIDTPQATPTSPTKTEERVPIILEMKRAAKIYSQSKQAVTSMFKEARMGKAIDSEKARELVEEISGSVMRNPGALISLARLKTADEYTYMHSVAVCALMIALARQLGLNEEDTREAGLAGLLHDMGKAMIPLKILNKPGRLTEEEFAIIKQHPEQGHQILMGGDKTSAIALDVCLHHHEKVDGTGYPKGLTDENISLFAKMGAVCDVYDAITSNRPYKEGWNPAESLRKMAEWSKGHFDEKVFQAFVKSVGIYPIGSFVRLESGRLGVVIEQNEQSLIQPKVRVFFSSKSNTQIKPEIVDLARMNGREKIVGREEPSAWGIRNVDEMWGAPPVNRS